MKRTPILIAVSLLLTACLTAGAYLAFVFSSRTIGYADLEIEEHDYKNNTFTVKVRADEDGMYLYKVLAVQNGEGELVLTFRGGKQPSRAQTKGEEVATFSIDVPTGTTRITCDDLTVYTVKK